MREYFEVLEIMKMHKNEMKIKFLRNMAVLVYKTPHWSEQKPHSCYKERIDREDKSTFPKNGV